MGFIPIVNRQNTGFQLVTSTNALYYFPEAVHSLREVRRVIAPSGNLIVPDSCRDYIEHFNVGKILMIRGLSVRADSCEILALNPCCTISTAHV